MRILYLIDTLSLGGAQTVLKGIFENQKTNNDIYIYALRRTEITVNIDHPNVIIDDSPDKYSIGPFFRLKKIIKSHKIEIIHCQLPRSHVFGYFIKKYFNKKLKLIIHEQGDIFENFTLHSHFLRKAAGFAALFIACSNSTRKVLLSKTGISEEKAVTIYNFVDTEKFNPMITEDFRDSERNEKSISSDCFVFGFAGRLIERKGWKEFVLSAKAFTDEKNVKFVIAGGGEDESELKELIVNSGLDKKVIYLGYYDDMPKFYALIDCLVVPSHWEPMGITEIEAMALKIPVIASNVIGLNEVVVDNQTGLLFNAEDINALENAIKLIYSEKELRLRLTEMAFSVLGKFTYETFQNKLNEAYKKI
jgi:glycosyltransferase involved in cell wall biosynthesis